MTSRDPLLKKGTLRRGPKPSKVDPQGLLDAAQAVFSREGLQGASMRAIAREAGCDAALLYYHFASKEAIFGALLARKWPPVIEAIQKLADPMDMRSSRTRIAEVLTILDGAVGQDAGFRAMVRGQAAAGAEQVKDLIAEGLRRMQEPLWLIFQQGVARGELRPDLKVPFAAFFLMRTYLEILDLVPSFAPRIVHMPTEQALAIARSEWLDFFWRGVVADSNIPNPTERT